MKTNSLLQVLKNYGSQIYKYTDENQLETVLPPSTWKYCGSIEYPRNVINGHAIAIPRDMDNMGINFEVMGSFFDNHGLHMYIFSLLKRVGLPTTAIGVSYRTPLPSSMYLKILFILKLENRKRKFEMFNRLVDEFTDTVLNTEIGEGLKSMKLQTTIDAFKKKDKKVVNIGALEKEDTGFKIPSSLEGF